MIALSERFRRVRIVCGTWDRILSPAVLKLEVPSAIFLDPPYSAEAGRAEEIYSVENLDVAHAVRAWALEHGDDPDLRIAVCGYEGEHDFPETWEKVAWKTQGGYANEGDGAGKENAHRERVWFSPHCVKPEVTKQLELFS